MTPLIAAPPVPADLSLVRQVRQTATMEQPPPNCSTASAKSLGGLEEAASGVNKLKLFIDGEFVHSRADGTAVTDPATQEVLCEVPFATADEVDRAVQGAKAAFRVWRDVPIPERARLLFAYQDVLKKNREDLARTLCRDTGKTLEDARGEVWRGIEVVEHACGIASLMMGETVENVARGIDTYSLVQPIGVCVGITPFNFPAMVPLWMFPLAIACGNSFVLKPSEQDPMVPNRLAALLKEAGAPDGLLQVVHGGKEQVDALLEHPDVRAVSFVGSAPVARQIYAKAAANGKRVQALAGAKNHLVILPDANKEQAVASLVGATCGAAGQRCMAISAAVLVGGAAAWLDDLREAMAAVRPGPWDDEGAAYGPQITRAARLRIVNCIERGKAEGADCRLDGSDCHVPGYPDGNWIGPTLFAGVTPDMSIYTDEIFGPVLVTSNVETLDDAIDLVNANPYGNGVSLFTSSGGAARRFQREIEVGQVGINIPIPVPLPFFSFTGWKDSFFGDQHAYGKQAVRFYTETKTVTTRWFDDAPADGPNMTIKLG